jgi:hypothetical protein
VADATNRATTAGAKSGRPDKAVTFRLTVDDHRALRQAGVDEDATMSEIIRALIALLREDATVQAKVRRRLKAG